MSDKSGVEASAVASRLGWPSGLEILEANETTLSRGHHLALVATEGSGVEALYALAVLLTGESDPPDIQALVLCPTDERAGRVARALQAGTGPDGFTVFLAGQGWNGSEKIPPRSQVVVSRPSRLLPAVRSGRVGLGSLRLLILDGADGLAQLDEWSSVEPILDTLGPDVRKIASTGRPDADFRDLLERQLPRARRWPEELLPIAGSEDTSIQTGPVLYVAVCSESDRLAVLESCVAEAERQTPQSIVVRFAGPEDVTNGAAALAVAGRRVTVEGPTARVERGDVKSAPGAVILLGTPGRLSDFEAALVDAALKFVVIPHQQLANVEALSSRAGFAISPFGGTPTTEPADAVAVFRKRVESAALTVDLGPELLVLEPLIDRFGAVRIAAALSRLLRRRDEPEGTVVPWPDIEAASLTSAPPSRQRPAGDRPASRQRSAAPPRGARTAWTRLYFDIGRKDDVKPGDLVGAITGEAGIVGGQIGKIDIRGAFTLIEIDSQVVDDVARKLAGVTIRGREVTVRPDRDR